MWGVKGYRGLKSQESRQREASALGFSSPAFEKWAYLDENCRACDDLIHRHSTFARESKTLMTSSLAERFELVTWRLDYLNAHDEYRMGLLLASKEDPRVAWGILYQSLLRCA